MVVAECEVTVCADLSICGMLVGRTRLYCGVLSRLRLD